eukprot:11165922-Lingulodinium_polyedra.AAC.1
MCSQRWAAQLGRHAHGWAAQLRPPRAWMGRPGPLDQRAPLVDDIGHPVDTDGPRSLADTFAWFQRCAARLDDFQLGRLRA